MKTLKIIDFDKQRPNSEPLLGSRAKYYLIKISGYTYDKAMYLRDENGSEDWYTSYNSKVIEKVKYWVDVEPLNAMQ